MKPKTKRQRRDPDRTGGLAGQDRISGLPDALLCHILSFLQTIYAVRTCVLSRRWKNIWESVPTLDFDYGPFRKSLKLKTIADYVLSLRNSSSIQKFRLNWNYNGIDQSCIYRWIHTAIKRNVVELDLLVYSRLHCHIFELRESILMCKTLIILKLRSNFIANLPASGCFPSLKFLHVTVNPYSCSDSMVELFSSCCLYPHLHVHSDIANVHKVPAPAVKTLRICCNTRGCKYKYLINCPKLENLVLKGNALRKYCLGQAESLVKASVELLHHRSNSRVDSLVTGVSSVKFLCLSANCFEVGSLPAFDSLSKLKLVVHKCFPRKLLTELLSRSPHLQYLILEHNDTSVNEKESKYGADSEPDECPKLRWRAPELVPSCLESNLETISIEGFKGQLNTMEVAKYFLRNGEVLKKMTFSSHPLCEEKQALHKELLMVPKVSKACVVDFV
ncbi:putative F-box/FBD/LRR-repeat protein At4g26350 [Rosa rugosa]|uniref:putative F-box/FBD/LRR-repeat protein At4g26350 n=1 Tax=Rosa rugosa TaxID=74645 RepID=UPI002B416118|nr:putative F-box/FBD/LRR-repeat protein At4g26350 [Rosa rugosa]